MIQHRDDFSTLESPEEIASVTRSASRAPFAAARSLDKARELARSLAIAQNNAALYPPSHPLVAQATEDLVASVAALVDLGFDEVTVNVYKATLFVENQVLPEESVTYRRLVEDLTARGVSAITFGRDLTLTDAATAVRLLNDPDVEDIEDAEAFLDRYGVTSVTVAETTALDETVREAEARENKARGRESYDAGIELIRDLDMQA